MVDFDVARAVVLTLSGVGTAFVTLIALVILTRLMGKFLEPSGSPTEPPTKTLINPPTVATVEATSSPDAALVAASSDGQAGRDVSVAGEVGGYVVEALHDAVGPANLDIYPGRGGEPEVQSGVVAGNRKALVHECIAHHIRPAPGGVHGL